MRPNCGGVPRMHLAKLASAKGCRKVKEKAQWSSGSILFLQKRCRMWWRCVKNVHRFSVCSAIWRSLVPSGASLATPSLNALPLPPPFIPIHSLAFAEAGGWRVRFQCQITIALLHLAVLWRYCPKQSVYFALTLSADTKKHPPPWRCGKKVEKKNSQGFLTCQASCCLSVCRFWS